MMKKYRKRPLVIDAIRWDGTWECYHKMQGEFGGKFVAVCNGDGTLRVKTLEGFDVVASNGDFIIRGIKGEFYPCKPGIFAECYELVSAETQG